MTTDDIQRILSLARVDLPADDLLDKPLELPEEATLSHFLSAEAAFAALQDAVHKFRRSAPEDHDIVIHAFNTVVTQVEYVEPYLLAFRGFDQEGNHALIVVHFSQLVATVIHSPIKKDDPRNRIITGFAKQS